MYVKETEILATEEILLPYSEDFWAVRHFLGLEYFASWDRVVAAYGNPVVELRRQLERETIESSTNG
jgi:hypothetical protein